MKCKIQAPHQHESADQRELRETRLRWLIRGTRRALFVEDYRSVYPPRGPRGCIQNVERQRVARRLARAGFVDANSKAGRGK